MDGPGEDKRVESEKEGVVFWWSTAGGVVTIVAIGGGSSTGTAASESCPSSSSSLPSSNVLFSSSSSVFGSVRCKSLPSFALSDPLATADGGRCTPNHSSRHVGRLPSDNIPFLS